MQIEMHAHDDLGLATANTLAAALAGASHLNTTVNGLGERAGNAALEEVVIGLEKLYGFELPVDLSGFCELSRTVAHASGRPLFWQKSLVGEAHLLTKPVFTSTACSRIQKTIRELIQQNLKERIVLCWENTLESMLCKKCLRIWGLT